MVDGAVAEQRQLVPPLAEREEQRQQRRAHEQPGADRHVTATAPATARSTNPPAIVRTSMMTMCFSDDRVEHEQRRGRRRRRSANMRPISSGRGERADAEHAGRDERRRADSSPDAIGREPLERMPPIGVAVGDVVEQIDGARQRAEDRERRAAAGERRRRAGGRRRAAREDEQVLRPLLGAQRAAERRVSASDLNGSPRRTRRATAQDAHHSAAAVRRWPSEKLRTASASLS